MFVIVVRGINVVASTKDALSEGIYTWQQAAYLACLRPQTVARWYEQTTNRGAALKRMLPDFEGEPAVSFVELVQLMAIRAIRLDYNISLQKIRQTVAKAEELGHLWPLAKKGIGIYQWGEVLVLKLPDGSYIEASGKFAKHYLIDPVILPYLQDIKFEGKDGLASEYRPKVTPEVILKPTRHWGAPTVDKCDYTVATLVNAVRCEKSIEAAARMCGVTEADIQAALNFEDFLRGAAV